MAPTLSTLLLVALFWTLPASAAALVYRAYGSSFERMKEEGATSAPARMRHLVATALPTA